VFNINDFLAKNPRHTGFSGAPMGDTNFYYPPVPGEPYTIDFDRVVFQDGCYAKDGTYWGLPANLWCFYNVSDKDPASNAIRVRVYLRANSPAAAMEAFLKEYSPPNYEYTLTSLDDSLLERALGGLPEIVEAYLEAVAFTDFGDEHEPEDGSTFGPVAQLQAHTEVLDFLKMCSDAGLFQSKGSTFSPLGEVMMKGYTFNSLAHDFWLTRNRHGAGFWDRGLGDVGKKLTELAHSCGERSVYLGDDNLVYFQ
jgi:hypothetical protein